VNVNYSRPEGKNEHVNITGITLILNHDSFESQNKYNSWKFTLRYNSFAFIS